MKYRSILDTAHWFLLVYPRCKRMPSMKPLSLVVTEKLTYAHKLNILIMRTRSRNAHAHMDAHRGYRISTPLLRKGALNTTHICCPQPDNMFLQNDICFRTVIAITVGNHKEQKCQEYCEVAHPLKMISNNCLKCL